MKGRAVQFAVLGPLEVTGSRAPVERPSRRRMLAILLQAGAPLDPDRLADRFWPRDRPATWKASLQTHVSALRKLLGADVLIHGPGGYALDLDGHEVDVEAFATSADRARSAGREGRWEQVVEAVHEALRWWRGEPYPELADDDFAMPDIVRLTETRIELDERRAAALLQLGDHERALPDLEALATEHPLRERTWELLITARARSGRIAEALEAHRTLRAGLTEQGLEPGRTLRELETRILREDPTVVGRPPRHNLPLERTTFVGRERELDELGELLDGHRLVTVTGVGGSGKTRLAQQVARRHLDWFPDGVRMVQLAAVDDPEGVATTTALAFGLRAQADPRDALRKALAHRTTLCLLDNCEHVLDAAAEVAELLLSAGPGVRVLATSRTALALPDEARFDVPPLPTPSDEHDLDDLDRFPAVELLIDRARLASHRFSVTPDDAPSIARLCRRLDGLPLALELAAAHLATLSPRLVVERLTEGLGTLARDARGRPDRHRGLEATIAWSHDLLTPEQRTLFARLSVFAGPVTLAATEAVCADDTLAADDVGLALTDLVDRSLVTASRDTTGTWRYRMLETVRAFARKRLAESTPGTEGLADRHLAWAVDVARELATDLDRPDHLRMLERLEVEREDLIAARRRADERGRDGDVITLATVLAWFWAKQGHYGRAIDRFDDAIARVDEDRNPERGADLRSRVAGIHYSAGRERDALRESTRARDLVAETPPSAAKVRALTEHASQHMRIVQREPEVAITSAREAIEAASAIGDRFAEAHALRTLGTALSRAGDHDEGIARLRDGLMIARSLDHDSELLGIYLGLFVTLLEETEDHAAAMEVADEAITWLDRGGDRLAGSASLMMWISYGSVKAGHIARADMMLERSTRHHLEGAMRMSELALRCMLHWTRGKADELSADTERMWRVPATPRYYRVLYPLEAEAAAARGDLEDVRESGRRHLAEDLRDVEQPLKTGTLWPAVRLEVDAALRPDGDDPEEHHRQARELVDRMRSLIERYPPSPPSGFRLEMPGTYLALAKAELTRPDTPDPDSWQRAHDRASFLYWRTYARIRRAEALFGSAADDEATRELHTAHADAAQLRASRLLALIEEAAAATGIDLDTEPVSPTT